MITLFIRYLSPVLWYFSSTLPHATTFTEYAYSTPTNFFGFLCVSHNYSFAPVLYGLLVII